MKTIHEFRERHISSLNAMLKYPGMWFTCEADLEIAIRAVLSDLYFIDDIDRDVNTIVQKLCTEGLYSTRNIINGVSKLFQNIQPNSKGFDHQIASIYAAKAHEAGYLQCWAILVPHDFRSLKERVICGEFSSGYDLNALLEVLPPPTFVAGKTTLCYVSENSKKGWLYFDLPTHCDQEKGRVDILCSIRWLAETFEEGFELTKEGYERTPRGIAFQNSMAIRLLRSGRPAERGPPTKICLLCRKKSDRRVGNICGDLSAPGRT